MNLYLEGQSIRLRHGYNVVPVYGVGYTLSFDGISLQSGTPTLALPENVAGLYEVVLEVADITLLGLVPEKVYSISFSGYSDAGLTTALPAVTYEFSIVANSSGTIEAVSSELTAIIARVRSRLSTDISALYTDAELEDILIECLGRHDDFYWNFTELPARELPLVEKLAQIECVQGYMGSVASSGLLEVQGLAGRIKQDNNSSMTNLIKYIDNMQKQYDNDCARMGVGQYKIEQGFRTRLDKETRTCVPRDLASIPMVRILVSGVYTSDTTPYVTLTWNKAGIPDFYKYEVYRANVLLATIYDGLVTTYTDDELALGVTSYVYKIKTYNRNLLIRESNEITVTLA